MSSAAPPRKPEHASLDQQVAPSEALLRRLGVARPVMWAGVLTPHCAAQGIDRPLRLSLFLGHTLHETAGFARLEEDLHYSARRLTQVWPGRFPTIAAAAPFAANPEALAERVYGGRMGNINPGDGYFFRGRGLMMTTGRDNFCRLALATGRPLIALPAWMETPEGAAESAARFWAWAGCNALADAGETALLRRRINGGEIGLLDVRRRARAALAFLCPDIDPEEILP